MKPEEQIHFLSELLKLIDDLQKLTRDYCRVMVAEKDESSWLEPEPQYDKAPF